MSTEPIRSQKKPRPTASRQRIDRDPTSLVEMKPLAAKALPLLIQARLEGLGLVEWCRSSRALLEEKLRGHGGILLRGFSIQTAAELESLLSALAGELLHYTYRSTPRSEVEGRIYTSTEYPADQHIPLHNEMSYSRSWPMKIAFLSLVVAAEGGETPIADSRRVLAAIAPEVQAAFRERGVMYVRNYGGGLDLPWQSVFQTESRAEVEEFCRQAEMEIEWLSGDRLRTRQVCQGVARHPVLGDEVWFNQAHLFHVTSLKAEIRELLLRSTAEEDLPRNSYYGDGVPIEDEALAEIRAAFAAETVVFPWRQGDVALLDNMLAAHGRRPFSGPRRILVGMAEPYESVLARQREGGPR